MRRAESNYALGTEESLKKALKYSPPSPLLLIHTLSPCLACPVEIMKSFMSAMTVTVEICPKKSNRLVSSHLPLSLSFFF
jgi:hypothetical protein